MDLKTRLKQWIKFCYCYFNGNLVYLHDGIWDEYWTGWARTLLKCWKCTRLDLPRTAYSQKTLSEHQSCFGLMQVILLLHVCYNSKVNYMQNTLLFFPFLLTSLDPIVPRLASFPRHLMMNLKPPPQNKLPVPLFFSGPFPKISLFIGFL